jgi:hypothetical protein
MAGKLGSYDAGMLRSYDVGTIEYYEGLQAFWPTSFPAKSMLVYSY